MAPERVFQGYDIVDNDYFRRSTHEVRKWKAAFRDGFRLPEQYFLASARFVPSKNLPCLIRAYALYRAAFQHLTTTTKRTCSDRPWSLVLLGDGAERPALQTLIAELGLEGDVLLPGFEQYRALPAYYGLAGAFVHASTSEPWGLVVNEAMASRLPVLVSNRCGCAPDLVHDGRNGFTFDPTNIEELAKLMLKMSRLGSDRLAMGDLSGEVVAVWGPNRFGDGLRRAAEKAMESKTPKYTVWRKVLALAHMISRPRPRRRTY
jgi:glycosyltransferase involved in cell wall biosynthesis